MNMAGQLPGSPWQGTARRVTSVSTSEDPCLCTRKWYFSQQEIEDYSPSRMDGIDLKKESQVRKLYCSFLQELGMRLKVPQVTIACAMMLCHQFFMRQSHAKNDWQTVATASMFLACKTEDTPRTLRDVIVVAYEILHKQDPAASQRIRQREVYEKQKELILIGERLLMVTVAFDFDIQLPYKPLVVALKRMDIYPELAKVAWNFVNDWLCTTLCLQYKPHYIAAGSVFLAAKLQKVKLPMEKGKVWWQEFDISPKQLEEVIQRMLKLLEQDKKQVIQPTRAKANQSAASSGKATNDSPESCVSSGSAANRHCRHETMAESTGHSESLACHDGHGSTKEVIPPQNSVSGASSVIEDGDCESQLRTDQKPICENVSLLDTYRKIDVNRIREALKRKKSNKDGNVATVNVDEDSEAWIERELEDGVELAAKKGRPAS